MKWGQIEVEPIPAPTAAGSADDSTTKEPPVSQESRRPLPPTLGAMAIVRRSALWSAGFGLLPLPLVDFATTAGFSLKMLKDLAAYYGIEFRGELGRAAIVALFGGASVPLTTLVAGSLVKGIPFLGVPLSIASGSLSAGSTTYAIGRVFTAHFGAGGTLFDFDPEEFRDYFHGQISAGRDIVARR